MRAVRAGLVAAAAAGAAATGVLLAGSATAAGCAQVAVDPGLQGPTLSPATVTIVAGGCVSYTDHTAFTVRITVGSVSGSADPNAAVTFRETRSGSFRVSAQQMVGGQPIGGPGSGTLVVKPAPAPSPSASRSPAPTPRSTPSPAPSASSAPPQSTAAPSATATSTTSAPPVTTPSPPLPTSTYAGSNPPVISGIPSAAPTPSGSAPAVVVGQLQPPSGRGVGLPAAIAALLAVGVGAALVRVLLAEPVAAVDGRGPRVARSS